MQDEWIQGRLDAVPESWKVRRKDFLKLGTGETKCERIFIPERAGVKRGGLGEQRERAGHRKAGTTS